MFVCLDFLFNLTLGDLILILDLPDLKPDLPNLTLDP